MPLLDRDDAVDIAALAYARGYPPEARASIRSEPADFFVDEVCDIALSGSGEHLWCHVEKTRLTTQDAVQALSRATGVHPRQIGFAGMKDRVAVTRQWLSLAWPIAQPLPQLADIDGVTVLSMQRHDRKLKRGAHRANRFTLRLRDLTADRQTIEPDLVRIRDIGVPNYFGAQRFGRDGRNLALSRALFSGKRLSRNRRGFALSAARSLLFNAVLDARVRAGTWNRLTDGEAVMLDGSHSLFAHNETQQTDAELAERLAAFDIHPSGPLPGREADDIVCSSALALECDVLAAYSNLVAGLDAAGVDAARRALRLPVPDLAWQFDDADSLVLSFSLPPGAFATSVLRELVCTHEPVGSADSSSID